MWKVTMARNIYSEKVIMEILTEFKGGKITMAEICTKYGITLERFFRWWSRYRNWSWAEIVVLRKLRRENARLRRTIREIRTPSLN